MMNTIGTNRLRIYDLFYNKPLCDYIHDEKLNILIIGNGWVGNEAFKAAFWCGLYPNTKLNITIASQNAKEYETTIKKYLPGINEFADFNGEIKSKYHYANIDIKEVSFDKIKDAGITDNVCNFLNIFDQDYIIVSVGDEEINFLVAETLAECLQKSSKEHIINVFTNIAANNVFENIEVNPIGTQQNDFANILSMAKNTNFAYIMQNAGYSSVDINNVNRHFDEEFNDEFIASPIESNEMQQSITNFCGENYNVDSSIANALHIKYKLKYCQDQQKNIVDVINKKGNVYNTLIAWEHRRWNAFMTIRGFRQPKESEKSSLDFRGKNADKRLHICLCECGDNGILLDENPQLWELEDISALPELEKASIYCYRALKKYVKDENRIQKIYNDIDFLIKSTNAEIREMIEKYKKAVEMLFAEENNAYKLYENIFNGILKRIGNNKKASDKLLSIDKLLEPIKIFNKHIDFYSYDAALVDMIPICVSMNDDNLKVITICDNILASDIIIPWAGFAKNAVFISKETKSYVKAFFGNNGNYSKVSFVKNNLTSIESIKACLEENIKEEDSVIINIQKNASPIVSMAVAYYIDKYPIVTYDVKEGIVPLTKKGNFISINSKRGLLVSDYFNFLNGEIVNPYQTQVSYEVIQKLEKFFWDNNQNWTKEIKDTFSAIRKLANKQELSLKQGDCTTMVIKMMKNLGIIDYSKDAYSYDSVSVKDKIAFDMLTVKAGNLFELIVYYKMLYSGFFNDVRCGVKFWWGQNISNEIDVVCMHGFTPVLISCKAAMEIRKEYIYEILSLANSLNGIPVLAISQEWGNITEENEAQYSIRQRCKEMGVALIDGRILSNSELTKKVVKLILENKYSGLDEFITEDTEYEE